MNRQDFLKLNDNDQFNFLNAEAESGKNMNQILAETGLDKAELAKLGYYYVGNKFLKKPMRGYGKPQDG